MLLALTIALAIAEVHAEMAVEHLAPSVVKANPPQWVTAVAIVAKTNAIVALAIAKALVMAAVFLVLRDKLSFWLGSANALHFPTFQTLITMAKRLTWICLFLLAISGIKAQTYCYHCFKSCIKTNTGFKYSNEDYYTTFTFTGDCLYTNNTYPPSGSSRSDRLWKVSTILNEGVLMYTEYQKNIFGKWKEVEYVDTFFYHGYKVSGDRNTITYMKEGSSIPFEAYYFERCPDWNCR